MKQVNDLVSIVCFLGLIILGSSCAENERPDQRPNILFIPIDDLRPELGCYGNSIVKTPNIDRLAAGGVTFLRAYCQQAVCNPSRASLLTGLRPDSIRVWDLYTRLRDNVPDVVTLPQFFRQNGYTSVGLGKTFHNDIPDTLSWTEKLYIDGFPFDPDAVYAGQENLQIQETKIQRLKTAGKSRVDVFGHWYVKAHATESAEVEDDAYYDGAQTTLAIEKLQELAAQEDPFFLSVGYYRPHLPFNAPKKYWDLYEREAIPLAVNQSVPEDSPAFAVHGDQELRNYDDCHDLPLPAEHPWEEERQRELKHGYYASVSYIDAQIGKLLNELERLGLSENTLVVLWGDHGWKLGEHNSWGKMSNFEIDTHVPLIISGAGVRAKGGQSEALTELVDIYPTLLDIADFPIPEYLQGSSLVPLLDDPAADWKPAVFSQFLLGRFGPPEYRRRELMGYTIRTDQYRYVEWYEWNKDQQQRGELVDTELFDHALDPRETKNLAKESNYRSSVELLRRQLELGWKHARPPG